ncbi:MAG: ubiquinol-cytochrome c reductase iron-sulfur subunit [Armatimonadetes bacterium]|nr:ubiquinol-cytochrome c reductase iron-sulfur subunit [Armatimonadota bacterium]
MKWFRQRGSRPLWAEEFSVLSADERYVNRRQLAKFLVLTSFGMFVGNLWIMVRRWFTHDDQLLPRQAIARLGEVAVGGYKLFHYPREIDHCILMRLDERTYVAYSQKCTHLSCAVYFNAQEGKLECPCHEGFFSAYDGRVLQGPPPRPLPRIKLEFTASAVIATGVDLQTEA